MTRFTIAALTITFLSISFVGCGGESSTETASSGNSKKSLPLLSVNDVGELNSKRNSDIEADAQANSSRQPSSRSAAQDEGSGSKSDPETEGEESQQASSRNGLFPDIAMNSGGSDSSSRFGGGLFPNIDMGERDESDASSDLASAGGDTGDVPEAGGEEDSDEESDEAEGEAETEETISLLADAKKLFESHAESDAINVIYVNHLVSDEARSEYPLNWFKGLKEPRLLFRWGVGVVFTKPRDLDGRHPVIGDPGDEKEKPAGTSRTSRTPSRGGGGRLPPGGLTGSNGSRGPTSRSGSRTYKNIDTSRPDGFLMYYTGDFGLELISHLESRLKDDQAPYYGQVLKDVMEVEVDEEEETNSRNSRGGLPRGTSGSAGIEGGGGGRGASRSGNRAGQRSDEDESVLDRAMGRSVAAKPEDDFSGSIIPGVALLGVGKKAELVDRAKTEGVDMMIMFTVKVSKSRGSYFCTTNMKIVDVRSDENVFSSKGLKDNKVSEAVEDGDDPVKDEVEKAFVSVADKEFKAADMPKGLSQDNVKKRVGRLLKQKNENPLAAAVEVVSFHQAKLLSDELAKTALSRLFDTDESAVLISGTEEERLDFLQDWLPDGVVSDDG